MNSPTSKFLTAEWRHLAMLNFEVDPKVMQPLVPVGTELDQWQGRTFISVVGFLFLNTRVFGVAIPWHRDFEEVNLRFYVRRKASDGWRRGVVFVKEIVPRIAIALTARVVYGENYVAVPMSHRIEGDNGSGAEPRAESDPRAVFEPRAEPDPRALPKPRAESDPRIVSQPRAVSYSWQFRGRENRLALTVGGDSDQAPEGSEAEFITEHYWGYAGRRGGRTMEYRVEHPRWRIARATSAELDCDVAGLYGSQFVESLKTPPASAFLAAGSEVTVFRGSVLPS
ncbi:MAG: DUF2071 domain-containing protein [Acidobacteriota bacterium]